LAVAERVQAREATAWGSAMTRRTRSRSWDREEGDTPPDDGFYNETAAGCTMWLW